MIITSGLLAHEPLVIVLQQLRRELWQNTIDSEEKSALFAPGNAYEEKSSGVREPVSFDTWCRRYFSSQKPDTSCEHRPRGDQARFGKSGQTAAGKTNLA